MEGFVVLLSFLFNVAVDLDTDSQIDAMVASFWADDEFPPLPEFASIGPGVDQETASGQAVEGIVREAEAEEQVQDQNDDVGPSARPEQSSLFQQSVMEPDAANKDRDIATGKQLDSSVSDFDVFTERSTASRALDQRGTQGDSSRSLPRIESSQIRRVMPPDSSCQESMRVPDHLNMRNLVNVDRDASVGARKRGEKNVRAKQNIGARSLPQSDIKGKKVVIAELDDANCSMKRGKEWTLATQYGVNREVVGPSARPEFLQQSVVKHYAANKDRDIATGKQFDISISGFDVLTERSTASKALDGGGNIIVPAQEQHNKLGVRSVSGLPELIMTCTSTETKEVNSCAEQNVGVMPPPRGETSLVGASIGFSQVRGVRQPDSSSQQPVKENDITKQNVGGRSLPRIGSSGAIERQADQSSQQSINETNRGNVVSRELEEASGSRKQGKYSTLDTKYGISRKVLERHSGNKLQDVADFLGVSRSTLKRICRKHNISRWPPSKANKHNHQEFVQATHASIGESSQRKQPASDQPSERESTSEVQTTVSAKRLQDDRSIVVKATYKDDKLRFQLLVSSKKLDLEEEVAMRLNLSIGSFKIKYLDEDGDWILIACDADLRTCINTLTSSAKTTMTMLIDQLPSTDPESS